MRIAFIGTGYVGLVSGACFAELGFTVTCIDKDKKKIAALRKGNIPIFEPGLAELVKRHAKRKRLFFTDNLKEGLREASVIFIAVGTPVSALGDGSADLTYVYGAAKELVPHIKNGAVIVIKSTVPVGTGNKVRGIITKARPRMKIEMVSNPEFLREGCAVKDFMQPDRIIVGVESSHSKKIMNTLYQPLTSKGIPMVFTDIPTAELTKYAANAFLATKIAFINEMADLCEYTGADVMALSYGMGMDHRIGTDFLMPGPGYGGSCFPKDTLALKKIARDCDTSARIVTSVIASNEARKRRMASTVTTALGGKIEGKIIAVLGLAFKANTSDVRDSAALAIIPVLLAGGAKIRAYDPEAMAHAREVLPHKGITWCKDAYAAVKNTDVCVIVTEWQEFRSLDLARVKKLLKAPVLLDLRNIFQVDALKRLGFSYYSVGHPSSFFK